MPVPRQFAHLYRTAEWKEIRRRILERDRHRCAFCNARNGSMVERGIARIDGQLRMWWRYVQAEGRIHWHRVGPWRDDQGLRENPRAAFTRHWTTAIQLGIAHLNQNPEDNRDDNLAALCRRCHIVLDRSQHSRNSSATRKIRKDGRRPLLQLLEQDT